MIVKCQYCSKEFDKPSYRNQHEKDAHKGGAKEYYAKVLRIPEISRKFVDLSEILIDKAN